MVIEKFYLKKISSSEDINNIFAMNMWLKSGLCLNLFLFEQKMKLHSTCTDLLG